MWVNLRLHKRHRMAVPVGVELDGWPERWLGVLCDVSLGGARLEVPAVRLPPREFVRIYVEDAEAPLMGNVVWNTPDERTAGIKFTQETRGTLTVRRLIAMSISKGRKRRGTA